MRHRLIRAALVAAVASSMPLCAQAAPAVLRLAVTTSPQSKINTWGLTPWANDVNKAGGGAVEVKVFAGTSIASNVNVYERILSGVADAGFGIFGPFAGIFKKVNVAGLPFLAHDCLESTMALWQLYHSGLIADEFSKVKVLALFTFPAAAINTNKPIRTAEDLAGMKIASSDRIMSELVSALGATPVTMAPPEFYQALNRGTVSGAAVGWTAIMTFRLDDVTHYHLETDSGQSPAFVLMNKRSYARLPAAGKKAIDQYSGEVFFRRMGELTVRQTALGRKLTEAKPNQHISALSPAEAARWTKLGEPVVRRWLEATPDGARVLAAYRKAIAAYRAAHMKGHAG